MKSLTKAAVAALPYPALRKGHGTFKLANLISRLDVVSRGRRMADRARYAKQIIAQIAEEVR